MMTNSKARKETSPATRLASQITIALIAVFIYIVLMTVTGGAVYAIHGRRPAAAEQSVRPPSSVCPQANCPAIPECQEAFWMECEPKATAPPCVTPSAPYCQASCQAPHQHCPCPTASPCPTVRPTPAPPSIDVFLTSRRHAKSVPQWLNFYPPFSKERLTVVTTLLNEALEPWALAGYVHRCAHSAQHPRDETTCGFCRDRYAYVDCVMSSRLIEETGSSSSGAMAAVDPTWVNQPEFTAMRGQLPNIVYHMWDAHHFDDILNAIGRAVHSFTVRTDAGKSCRVCTEFNKRVYDKCFSEAGKKYPL